MSVNVHNFSVLVKANLHKQVKRKRRPQPKRNKRFSCAGLCRYELNVHNFSVFGMSRLYEQDHPDYGGGTGGPHHAGMAVADVLRALRLACVWMGAPLSMEAELVPKTDMSWSW